MDRIDTPNSVPDGNGPGKRGFRDGNKAEGINPTEFDAKWCNGIQEEIANVIEDAGIALDEGDYTLLLQAIEAKIEAATTVGLGIGYMLVQDQKSINTNGGNSVAGSNIRTLNTVVANTISGASLTANQITLPAGTYRIKADQMVREDFYFRGNFYNVTDASIAILGLSDDGIDGGNARASFSGRIVLSAPKVFELRVQTNSSVSNGLGKSTNLLGVEIYSSVEIIQEAKP